MRRLVYVVLAILVLSSCERLMMPKPQGSSKVEAFESLWKTLDEGYVHFVNHNINWDSLHGKYRSKVVDTMTDRQLYDTCVAMLAELKDPSVSLVTGFAKSHYSNPKPYQSNFNKTLLEQNYWKGHEQTGPFKHTIIDSIGYLYYESFDEFVDDDQLDFVIERLRIENDSIKGFIFDIRNNSGGDIANAFTLLKRMGPDTGFTITNVLFKTFYKDGPEHDNITESQTSYIEQSDKTKFPKQFILLTNRNTNGVAALFTAGALGYSNIKVFGDTTSGQTGRIVAGELVNGWRVEYPASYHHTDDDKPIERGIPPTKVVNMSQADEAQGKDSILEAALEEIKSLY